MRLTSFTDYSLRVLIYLTAHSEGRATIAEIGESFGISENHLVKIVHFLGKAGFLTNVRGRGGGMRLAMPATMINIGDVVRKTEPRAQLAECFDPATNLCAITPACRLRGVLSEAGEAFYAVLDRYTLDEIAGNRRGLAKILFMTPPGQKGRAQPGVAPAEKRS